MGSPRAHHKDCVAEFWPVVTREHRAGYPVWLKICQFYVVAASGSSAKGLGKVHANDEDGRD
jgi:hypothetical protein